MAKEPARRIPTLNDLPSESLSVITNANAEVIISESGQIIVVDLIASNVAYLEK